MTHFGTTPTYGSKNNIGEEGNISRGKVWLLIPVCKSDDLLSNWLRRTAKSSAFIHT